VPYYQQNIAQCSQVLCRIKSKFWKFYISGNQISYLNWSQITINEFQNPKKNIQKKNILRKVGKSPSSHLATLLQCLFTDKNHEKKKKIVSIVFQLSLSLVSTGVL